MNKFRATNILLVIVLILMLEIVFSFSLSLYWIIIPIVAYLIIVFLGTANIGWNYYMKSYNKAKTPEKQIAITFDDGPDSKISPEVLIILNRFDVKATFFCIGKNIIGNEAIVKNLYNSGHIIGNHSYSHSYTFDLMSSKKMTEEIRNTNHLIKRIINKTPVLFRPPFGVINPLLRKAIINTGMISVGWSLRTFDTVKDEDYILSKIKSNLKSGDVILCHDNSEKTLRCLEKILLYLKENNFKVVNLDKLLNIQAYA